MPSGLPDYVERDGDWVWQAPGKLTQVTMHLFVLKAEPKALATLCADVVDRPTGGAFRAEPLPPGFVLLTCADVGKGWSLDPVDIGKGWMKERDVGFFVPVLLHGPRGGGIVNLLPYLFVDNFAAVVIGREIFGFPKVLGEIDLPEKPVRFSVHGQALERFDAASEVQRDALLVSIREEPGDADDLFATLQARLRRRPTIEELTEEASRRTAQELARGFAAVPWAQVPMVFLKQFRDVAQRNKACHSALVRADARIDALSSLRVLGGRFSIELPPYASLGIAQRLGLGAPGKVLRPAVVFRAELDFTLPHGRVLWS